MEIHENFERSCQMNFEPGEDQSGFYKILIIVMVLIVFLKIFKLSCLSDHVEKTA